MLIKPLSFEAVSNSVNTSKFSTFTSTGTAALGIRFFFLSLAAPEFVFVVVWSQWKNKEELLDQEKVVDIILGLILFEATTLIFCLKFTHKIELAIGLKDTFFC